MSTSTTFQGLIPKLVVRKMADMEPTIGKHSAWKMILRDLIKMARACGSEFSPIGMLDELLSDAQLALLPGNPPRQNRALVPIVAGMAADAIATTNYNNGITNAYFFYKRHILNEILQAIGIIYVETLALMDPLNLGLINMSNLEICEQMNGWCTPTQRDIDILRSSLTESFLWDRTIIGFQTFVLHFKEICRHLDAMQSTVNDADQRKCFKEAVESNIVIAQAIDRYYDHAAIPVGPALPIPNFENMVIHIASHLAIRGDSIEHRNHSVSATVAVVNNTTSELETLREEIRSLRQQVQSRVRPGRFNEGRGSGRQQGFSGGGRGGRGEPASIQLSRARNSCYCWQHGFGQHYGQLNGVIECSVIKASPSLFDAAMRAATGPHCIPGKVGSTTRQRE